MSGEEETWEREGELGSVRGDDGGKVRCGRDFRKFQVSLSNTHQSSAQHRVYLENQCGNECCDIDTVHAPYINKGILVQPYGLGFKLFVRAGRWTNTRG